VGDPMFFDRVAATYEQARPGYPEALYDQLRSLGVTRPGATVLEVGAGTGQATRRLVDAGCDVVALEPAPQLADRLRVRVPAAAVVRSSLEQAELMPGTFDAAVAATALHWVDLARGLAVVHEALKGEGLLAVWRTVFGDPRIHTPFRERVAEIAARRPGPAEKGTIEELLDPRPTMAELSASGLFAPRGSWQWAWEIELSTAGIQGLFSTFGDWTPAEVDAAADAVESFGGSVTEHYVTVLHVLSRTEGCEAVSPALRGG
jgi:SAM-dependent methyltransferase